jgi:hypothetical protein
MGLHGFRRALPWCLVPLAVAAGPWAAGVFAQSPPDMTVAGILLGPTPVAIIRAGGYTFITKAGEPVGDAVVVSILPAKVVLKQGKSTFELGAPSASSASVTPAGPVRGATPAPAAQPAIAPVAPAMPRRTAPAPPGAGMTVTGILEGTRRIAIVQSGGQSYVAGAGDSVGDAVVVSVLPGKVLLKRNGALVELSIGGTVSAKNPG